MHWLYLYIAIIAEIIATSALKATEGFTHLLPSVVVIIGYMVAFFFLSLTLRTIPIGIAYAIWSGIGIVLVTLVGLFFFKQTLDIAGVLGIIFIIVGVLILNLFSKSVPH